MSVEPNAKDRLHATEITNALVFARRAVDYELPAFEMTSIITPILAVHRAADDGELAKALREIAEYWNGHETEAAMLDACVHNERVARAALARHAGKEAK